jgi:hypothetical protein
VSRVIAVDDFDPAALEPHYATEKPSANNIEGQKAAEQPLAEVRAAE